MNNYVNYTYTSYPAQTSAYTQTIAAPQEYASAQAFADPRATAKKTAGTGAFVGTVVGAVLMILGILGTLVTSLRIYEEKRNWWYMYTAPFSDHEKFMLCIGVAFVVVGFIGAVVLIASRKD